MGATPGRGTLRPPGRSLTPMTPFCAPPPGTPQPLPPPPPPRRSARSPRSPNTATVSGGRRGQRGDSAGTARGHRRDNGAGGENTAFVTAVLLGTAGAEDAVLYSTVTIAEHRGGEQSRRGAAPPQPPPPLPPSPQTQPGCRLLLQVRPRPHGTTAPPTRPPSPTQRCRPPAAPPTPGGRSAPTATAMRTSPGNKPPPPPDGPFALPLTPLPHVLLSPTWDKRPPNPPNTAGEGDGGGGGVPFTPKVAFWGY